VQVDVLVKTLSPGVQYRRHAELALELAVTSAVVVQAFPDATKQAMVNDFGMALCPAIQVMRQGKHQVVVGHWQQIILPGLYPAMACRLLALRAMTMATTVVARIMRLALITGIVQPTEHRSMAVDDILARCRLIGTNLLLDFQSG
jgi:hypothetical protein